MRVIIAGGRDFNNYNLLKQECDKIFDLAESDCEIIDKSQIEIVCGLAKGADLFGKKYAIENKCQLKEFPANWDLHGKSAGYKRNIEMLNYAKEKDGMLIAFWDGKSKGTKNMIDISSKNGLRIFVHKY